MAQHFKLDTRPEFYPWNPHGMVEGRNWLQKLFSTHHTYLGALEKQQQDNLRLGKDGWWWGNQWVLCTKTSFTFPPVTVGIESGLCPQCEKAGVLSYIPAFIVSVRFMYVWLSDIKQSLIPHLQSPSEESAISTEQPSSPGRGSNPHDCCYCDPHIVFDSKASGRLIRHCLAV